MRRAARIAPSLVFALGCAEGSGPKAPEGDAQSTVPQTAPSIAAESIGNPHQDWDQVHTGRQPFEYGHNEFGHVASSDLDLANDKPDLAGRIRPELHLYRFEENGVEKRRFAARLHAIDDPSLVVRIDPNSDEVGIPGLGDQANGLHVMPNGEILIKPVGDAAVRFEFRVDNPGNGVGDYNC